MSWLSSVLALKLGAIGFFYPHQEVLDLALVLHRHDLARGRVRRRCVFQKLARMAGTIFVGCTLYAASAEFRPGLVRVDERFQKALLSGEVDDPLANEAGELGPGTWAVTDQMEQNFLESKCF